MNETSDANCIGGSKNCSFTCPSGGTFYSCTTAPYFVGCCSSNPCRNTVAPYCADLNPASFEPEVFDQIIPNDCLGAGSENWYTCNFTIPSFMGCCASNPCATGQGCPKEDLIPAAVSFMTHPEQLELFLDGAEVPQNGTSSGDGGLSTGAIAGIAIAAVAVVAVVILIAVVMFKRGRRSRAKEDAVRYNGFEPMRPAAVGVALSPPQAVYKDQPSPYSNSFRESYMSSPSALLTTPGDENSQDRHSDRYSGVSGATSYNNRWSDQSQPHHQPQGLGLQIQGIQELSSDTQIAEMDATSPQRK